LASEISSRAKTQTLSLRLDPKTRFILEFMSRVRGQSITTIVERAIKEAAEKTGIGPTNDRHGNETSQQCWSDFWDPEEGVRSLNLIANTDYPTTFDDDEIRRFTIDHWEFFYVSVAASTPRRQFVSVLWPKLQSYMTVWRNTKSEDYWAAGRAMGEDLTKAKLGTPVWPRLPKAPESNKATSFGRDLNDEVPF
jgi:8-oxo-dGTP pyrophosphatase MutT (NUDIX family)